MYTVDVSNRQNWAFEVRWNGGRCYARCLTKQDAAAIALALNAMCEMKARGTKALTPVEVAALSAALEASKRKPLNK